MVCTPHTQVQVKLPMQSSATAFCGPAACFGRKIFNSSDSLVSSSGLSARRKSAAHVLPGLILWLSPTTWGFAQGLLSCPSRTATIVAVAAVNLLQMFRSVVFRACTQFMVLSVFPSHCPVHSVIHGLSVMMSVLYFLSCYPEMETRERLLT